MTNATPSVFLGRPDTMLGICEAIGQDLGFNANWLRVALGAGVIFNPYAAFAVYGVLGMLVLLSRVVFPVVKRAVAPTATVSVLPTPLPVQPEAFPELAMAA